MLYEYFPDILNFKFGHLRHLVTVAKSFYKANSELGKLLSWPIRKSRKFPNKFKIRPNLKVPHPVLALAPREPLKTLCSDLNCRRLHPNVTVQKSVDDEEDQTEKGIQLQFSLS